MTLNLDKEDFLNSLYPEHSNDDFDVVLELSKGIDSLIRRGFLYLDPREDFYPPIERQPYVHTPSGSKLNLADINRRLRRIIVGDPSQREAISAWECYMFNDIHNNGW